MQELVCGYVVHCGESAVLPGFDALGSTPQVLARCVAIAATIRSTGSNTGTGARTSTGTSTGGVGVQLCGEVAILSLPTSSGCVLLAAEAPLPLLATTQLAHTLADILHRHGSLSTAVPELLSALQEGEGEAAAQTLMTSDADVLSFKTELKCDDVMPFQKDSFHSAFDVSSFLPNDDNLLASGLLQPELQQSTVLTSPANSMAASKFSDMGFGSPVSTPSTPVNALPNAADAGLGRHNSHLSPSSSEFVGAADSGAAAKNIHVVVAISEDVSIQFQNNVQQKVEVVGTVTLAVKQQQQPAVGPRDGDANGHDNRTNVTVRVIDAQSRLGPCQLNPQVEAVGKRESDTSRLIRCRVASGAEPQPVMKYKCAPEFRPALLRTRCALQVRDAMAKITVEVASNPAVDMPLSQVVVRASLAKLAACAPINSVQTRPEGRYDTGAQVIEWRCQLNPGDKSRFEALLQLESSVQPTLDAATLGPVIAVTGTAPHKLVSDLAFSVESAADATGTVLHAAVVNIPTRVRVAVRAV